MFEICDQICTPCRTGGYLKYILCVKHRSVFYILFLYNDYKRMSVFCHRSVSKSPPEMFCSMERVIRVNLPCKVCPNYLQPYVLSVYT